MTELAWFQASTSQRRFITIAGVVSALIMRTMSGGASGRKSPLTRGMRCWTSEKR
jgi:hypothetical protein